MFIWFLQLEQLRFDKKRALVTSLNKIWQDRFGLYKKLSDQQHCFFKRPNFVESRARVVSKQPKTKNGPTNR